MLLGYTIIIILALFAGLAILGGVIRGFFAILAHDVDGAFNFLGIIMFFGLIGAWVLFF